MKAGFGKGIITFPEELFPLSGEGFCGIHDDPCVRLLYLEQDDVKMLIVVFELVGYADHRMERIRKILKDRTGVPEEHMWMHVTHAISTPHVPGTAYPEDGVNGKAEIYCAAVEKAVNQAVEELLANISEACIGWGTGYCDINSNRDIDTPFGRWIGLNREGESNKTVTVMKVSDLDGSVKGCLVSYGVKPCVLDNAGMKDGTRLVSPEMCGIAMKSLEEKYDVPFMFCMSAAGDQVPIRQALYERIGPDGSVYVEDAGVEKGFAYSYELAEEFFGAVDQIAAGITHYEVNPVMELSAVESAYPTRVMDEGPYAPRISTDYCFDGEQKLLHADILRLGNAVFVAVKPEVNACTERELIEASPFGHTVLISMVNGGMKYLPDLDSFHHHSWEVSRCRFMPGTAEKFFSLIVEELKNLV